MVADRRAGKIPHVGKQPRVRNQDGSWRKKRSDAGKKRKEVEAAVRFVIRRNAANQFWWRAVGDNNKIMAASD